MLEDGGRNRPSRGARSGEWFLHLPRTGPRGNIPPPRPERRLGPCHARSMASVHGDRGLALIAIRVCSGRGLEPPKGAGSYSPGRQPRVKITTNPPAFLALIPPPPRSSTGVAAGQWERTGRLWRRADPGLTPRAVRSRPFRALGADSRWL